jgi:uncharacterized protein (TIGR00369 family)
MSLAEDIASLRADGRLAEVNALFPYARFLGIVSGFEGEELVTRLPFREDHIGNFAARIFHGGIVGAMLEQAAFVHLLHHVRRNQLPKVINISTNYLRPVAPKDVFASCVIVRQGMRIANVRVRAWQNDRDEPVATADVHLLLPKPKDQT